MLALDYYIYSILLVNYIVTQFCHELFQTNEQQLGEKLQINRFFFLLELFISFWVFLKKIKCQLISEKMPDNDVPTTYYVLPYTNYYSNPISRYIDT